MKYSNHMTHLCVIPTVAMLLFSTACVKQETEHEKTEDVPMALSFDAYLNRGLETKAGVPEVLDGSVLADAGFGVFAFYGSQTPDFMYNTRVTNPTGAKWVYDPMKYWPNEPGAAVSFYAYAPHAATDPFTGALTVTDNGTPERSHTTGITGVSSASNHGAPLVSYKSSFYPAESVDLCWSAPVTNVMKPGINSKVKFNFKHALAALNVTVDAITDEVATTPTNQRDSDTRVYVREVTFEGFASKGTLSLDGVDKPQWSGYAFDENIQRTPLTIYDGRLDGIEARYDDPGESPSGINSAVLQKGTYNQQPGVNATTMNLFDGGVPSAPVFVIPNGYPLKITLVYDIETRDDKLTSSYLSDGSTHGSSKRVTISQSIATSSGIVRMEAGKKYVLRLHLGLTSVKFAAELGVTEDWSEDPHPANFEAVIVMGQDYYEYEVDDSWRE